MQAIEFIADTEDGVIKIPKKYLKNLKKEVRVIILMNEERDQKKLTKNSLTALKIKTKGLKFNRNEANER